MPSSRAIVRMVEAIVAYSAPPAAPSPSARSRLVAMRVRTIHSGLVTTSVSAPAKAAALQCTSAEVIGSPVVATTFSLVAS